MRWRAGCRRFCGLLPASSQVHRRPYAVGAEDIGTWFTFLDIMSTLAVVSNMALFCFTGNQLSDAGWSWQSRIVFFSVSAETTKRYFSG
jgi:hypothetical protein